MKTKNQRNCKIKFLLDETGLWKQNHRRFSQIELHKPIVLINENVLVKYLIHNENKTNTSAWGSGKHCDKICRKKPVQESLFFKIPGLRPATLLKRRIRHRCFPVTFPIFLTVNRLGGWGSIWSYRVAFRKTYLLKRGWNPGFLRLLILSKVTSFLKIYLKFLKSFRSSEEFICQY